jgi:prepilin-type N-terminal cleavage/methylation domain-containing protein
MKNLKLNQKRYKGFTLIELLVVVVIIAVLMGMLIPAVMRAKVRARIATARADMSNIKGAILSYQTDYSRFPVPRPLWVRTFSDPTPPPTALVWADNKNGGDTTFGGTSAPGDPPSNPNYGVMRILCSVDDSTPPTPTLKVNGNFSRNPKKNKYLDVPSGDDLGDPGLDPVYNFNDPWRGQYIITMDMDGDGDCSDKYYREADMNANVVIGLRSRSWTRPLLPGSPPGTSPSPPITEHALTGSVMIYSRGPDQEAGSKDAAGNKISALEGVNEDNILDWR